jgi:hypothetical protein
MKYGIALLLITISITGSAQEEKPVPKDSVRVSIPGCSKGSAFVVTESPEGERTSIEIKTGRRFRLTGKKELLNEIKAREGYMIAVTGIVRRNDLEGPRRHLARRRPRAHRRRCPSIRERWRCEPSAAVDERDYRCGRIPAARRTLPKMNDVRPKPDTTSTGPTAARMPRGGRVRSCRARRIAGNRLERFIGVSSAHRVRVASNQSKRFEPRNGSASSHLLDTREPIGYERKSISRHAEARPPRGMRAAVLAGGSAKARTLHRRTHKGPPRGGPDSCWSG